MDNDSEPTVPRVPQQRTKVFISYSHKDEKWLEELKTNLKPLERKGDIFFWDDQHIEAGSKWREEITKALASARVAVLLVSPDFLDSDFIYKHELPPLLKAAEQEGLTILWIALRDSLYGETPIGEYQAVNNPRKPLNSLSRAKRDAEWVKISKKIKQFATIESGSDTPETALPPPIPSSVPLGLSDSDRGTGPVQEGFPEDLINFENQQNLFVEMLEQAPQKRLMFIQAPEGYGKSSLLRMLRFHCQSKGVPCSRIDFHGEPYDTPHVTLPRLMCDQFRLVPRNMAQTLLPLSTYRLKGDLDSPDVISQILDGVSLTNERLRQRDLKDRLRDALLADLRQCIENKGRVVCLFDTFEDGSAEAEEWLIDTLLRPVAQGALKNLMVVTAGQRWPRINKWEWEKCTHFVDGLPRMSVELIKVYAEKVNIRITDEDAKAYWKASGGGIPNQMAIVIHNVRTVEEVRS